MYKVTVRHKDSKHIKTIKVSADNGYAARTTALARAGSGYEVVNVKVVMA